jgi:SAM-dependent MidA family methyltransferase
VRAAIEDHGPIGFDEYMAIALYGPGGFFETPPVGPDGHFVTSPHVHPFVFAHCVRDALIDPWFALGEPEPFSVVELGAGTGTLADALLSAFAELPAPNLAYTAVEISPGARDAIAGRGRATASAITELGPFEGAIVANEVVDNLPFALLRGRPDGPREVRVGLRGSAFVEVEVPWPEGSGTPPPLEPGEETTVPVAAFALLETVARTLRRGYFLLIDYGNIEDSGGPVHGYREHREVADVLADPGDTDITAGVDMASIVERVRALGLTAFEPVTQQAALRALGHDRWERTMRATQTEFQRVGRDAEAVRIWEERSRASLLADPAWFGGFWWLLLATHGLPEPPWLARARTSAERPEVR